MKVIGITGYAGSGKSTLALGLMGFCAQAEPSTTTFSLAYRIKELAAEMFGWAGDKTAYFLEDGSLDKRRGRGLLVSLGAALRSIDEDIWLKEWAAVTDAADPAIVIVDDIRMDHEAEWLRQRYGSNFRLVKVVRPDTQPAVLGEPTEAGVTVSLCNKVVHNNSTIEDLLDQAVRLLGDFLPGGEDGRGIL